MRYLSVCSGIEASTVAWHPLGWQAAAFSEIEKFPRAVLAHHYPGVPCHGDFTTIEADQYGPVDLLVGGTPCQSFSVAGLRGGLGDDRGNLALEYLRLADRLRPRWLVWENVPGVLSSNGGRDFGSILGGLVKLGYGFAYRVLDAQHFGVPQRRRRVFVVGCLGDWRSAAAVLFERHSLQGHPAPRREAGKVVAPTISARPSGGGGLGTDFDFDEGLINWLADVAPTLNAHFGSKMGLDNQRALNGAGLFVPAIAFNSREDPCCTGDVAGSLGSSSPQAQAVAFGIDDEIGHCLRSGPSKADKPDSSTYVEQGSAVRRLTPRECERLQGFPDDYTLVPYRGKPAADGPRYKTIGNSMAVPVMRWIGERIDLVEKLTQQGRAA